MSERNIIFPQSGDSQKGSPPPRIAVEVGDVIQLVDEEGNSLQSAVFELGYLDGSDDLLAVSDLSFSRVDGGRGEGTLAAVCLST